MPHLFHYCLLLSYLHYYISFSLLLLTPTPTIFKLHSSLSIDSYMTCIWDIALLWGTQMKLASLSFLKMMPPLALLPTWLNLLHLLLICGTNVLAIHVFFKLKDVLPWLSLYKHVCKSSHLGRMLKLLILPIIPFLLQTCLASFIVMFRIPLAPPHPLDIK